MILDRIVAHNSKDMQEELTTKDQLEMLDNDRATRFSRFAQYVLFTGRLQMTPQRAMSELHMSDKELDRLAVEFSPLLENS